MADTKYSVSWDAYQNNICNGLSSLQQRGEFVDMTLAAEGHHVKVHQMVLSLVSPYIKDLITSAACPHPVIFLNRVSHQTLQSILQYAYTGEVVVPYDKIQEFLNACKDLHIRGLESAESFESRAAIESTDTDPPKKDRDRSTSKPQFVDVFSSALADCSNDNDDENIFDNNEELRSTARSVEETRVIGDTADTTLKFTISNLGTPQLVLNRYVYSLRSPRKNGENMWRCINYKREQCRAYIVVKGSKVLKRVCAHNHPFHDQQILKRLRNRNMFASMHEVQRAILLKKEEQEKNDSKTSKDTEEPDYVLDDSQ